MHKFSGYSFWAVPFFIFTCFSQLSADTKNTSLESLSNHEYWHSLLHYRTSITGTKSTIDDPKFFLAEDGKTNPLAELKATIDSFSSGDSQDTEHPVNRFPARLKWLLQQNPNFKDSFISQKSISFEKIWNDISPQSASVVFPTQYMNNPASLFGHTLINIEGKKNNKLLAYSINYSAITQEDNGIIFAFNGIFGFYKGLFSIGPYYQKVKEYSDLSMRDIWEYRLNFSDEELRNLMLHLWELQDIYSYYYFFDENCSYNLLFLLDVARPGSKMISKFGSWIIPVDTIKEMSKSNFFESVDYRPSRSTKIKQIASTLPYKLHEQSLEAVQSDLYKSISDKAHTREDKIRLLDLSTEIIKMKHADGEIPKKEYTKRFLGLLRQRSKLGKTSPDFYPELKPSQPENGHDSFRTTLGGGSYDGATYLSLGLRPAYHDLMDPSQGYNLGSAIEFLSGEIYYFEDEQKLELHELDLLSINSFSPMDAFFQSKSWKVSTGLKTIRDRDNDDRHLAYNFDSGIGAAFAPWQGHIFYIMAEPAVQIHRSLDHSYQLGLGGLIGHLSKWTDELRSHLEFRKRYYILGQENNLTEFNCSLAYTTSKNTALQAYFRRSRELNHTWNQAGLELQIFF